jgi:hypothetical protein
MRSLVILAVALAMPSISIAQTARCELATADKQTCRVKPTASHTYVITANASADAGDGHGNPQLKVHIRVDGEDCSEKETDTWENGPGSLQTTCQITLAPGTDHEIKGSATARDSKATGFALTVEEQ